eukprot:g4074.t1
MSRVVFHKDSIAQMQFQSGIVCARYKTLELLRPDDSGKVQSILAVEIFGVIRALNPFRLTGASRDYIVVASDSGRIVILEYDGTKNMFEKVHQETFGKTGCRRIVPGQYLAVDPKGRAVLIGAIEKQKFVYILNRDSAARLTISSPLEAHKSYTLVYAMVGMDVGFENPLFASIELSYEEVDKDPHAEPPQKMLTLYEMDLGLNHVTRKFADAVDHSAHALIAVPGGVDGPSGVNPKRTLTWPSEGLHNGGLDNSEHNYIGHVGDEILNQEPRSATGASESETGKSYELLESLGQGSFGQVLKCQVDQRLVALKIIKNRPSYFNQDGSLRGVEGLVRNQGCIEANVLKRLNSCFDPEDQYHIVRMLDCFVFKKHLCIAFELLELNLLEFLKWNSYKGFALPTIQSVTRQLLEAMICVVQASLIHCDLKPENVMVVSMTPIRIKLIDFGSACTESCPRHAYIQSRFYRSPEVILGLPYGSAIDIWSFRQKGFDRGGGRRPTRRSERQRPNDWRSLGCIVAELLLGLPLFPGQCEYDQLRCIVKIMGLPPKEILERRTCKANSMSRFCLRSGTLQDSCHLETTILETCREMLSAGSKSKRYFKRVDEAFVSTEEGRGGEECCEGPAEQVTTISTVASTATTADTELTVQVEVEVELEGSQANPQGPAQMDVWKEADHEQRATQMLQVQEPRRTTSWRLKTGDEYENDSNKKAARSRRAWPFTSIEEVVKDVPEENRGCLLQFLMGLFQMDPNGRWTARQALQHPFINEDAPFSEGFRPPQELRPGAAGLQGLSPNVNVNCRRAKPAPSSTTGTPASSPNHSSTGSVLSARQTGVSSGPQVPFSPWHLPSPGSASDSATLASDYSWSNTSGGERTDRGVSKWSDSEFSSASAGSREGQRRRREQKFWKQMQSMTRGHEVSQTDFREARERRGGGG